MRRVSNGTDTAQGSLKQSQFLKVSEPSRPASSLFEKGGSERTHHEIQPRDTAPSPDGVNLAFVVEAPYGEELIREFVPDQLSGGFARVSVSAVRRIVSAVDK